jgi:hypothetical protein
MLCPTVDSEAMKISRLKLTYQRNLLCGQAIAIGLVAGVTILLYWNTEPTTVIDRDNIRISDIYSRGQSIPLSESKEKKYGTGLLKSGVVLQKINILGDGHHSQPQVSYLPKLLREPISVENEEAIVPFDEQVEASTGEYGEGNRGGSLGDGWPIKEDNKALWEPSWGYYLPEFGGKPARRELRIDFARPEYPSKGEGINAIVTLDVMISSNGAILKCDILREEPPKHDFALSLKHALFNSWIEPAIINGRKVESRFLLTYEFCWDCPRRMMTYKVPDGIVILFNE